MSDLCRLYPTQKLAILNGKRSEAESTCEGRSGNYRSPASFLPPPLTSAKKRLIKRVNKIEAMYETARVSVKVKRYACC